MKANAWIRSAVALSLALPYVSALAQDVTLSDLLKGDKPAATIKVADLTDDYKAVRLKVAGDSAYSDMFSGSYGFLIAMSGGLSSRGNAGQMEFVGMLDVSWTKGETVHLMGPQAAAAKAAGVPRTGVDDEYLVTYKLGLGIGDLMGLGTGGKEPPQELKLSLVKLSSVASVSPAPEITKERLTQALAGLKGAMGDGTEAMVAEKAAGPSDGPPASADQTKAINNAKQISVAAIMYCSDYDDLMPYVQSVTTMKEVTMPYVKSVSVWETKNPASQWRMNMAVSGVAMSDIPEPASTPLFYESATWPDGRRVVAFCDSHAELVTKERWNNLAKYLKLKLKRTAKKPLPLHVGGYREPGAPREAPDNDDLPPTEMK